MAKMIDITGRKFGRLLVTGFAGRKRSKTNNTTETLWDCLCDCGNKVVVPKHLLTSGNTKSCGCLKRERNIALWTTHGKTHTRLYRIWQLMKYRCYSSGSPAYEYYGGKGVQMCNEWIGENGFQNFHDWALSSGYKEHLTIERIDVDGDYAPNNCTWITQSEQPINRTNTHWIDYKGISKTVSEWGRLLKVSRSTIRKYERDNGYDHEKALGKICEKWGIMLSVSDGKLTVKEN